jgi:hypothetical protein
MRLQFAVGFKLHGKSNHVIVEAEDALIAALKVKYNVRRHSSHMSADGTKGVTHVILHLGLKRVAEWSIFRPKTD